MQTAPPNCGLLFFEKLHGSIEDKFPCRYFWGRVKNKNQTIWVYSEKFAFQILNFFKMSISEPVFSLQTHIQLFICYLQQIQYLTTQFFCIDPKTQNAHGGRNVMPRCLSEGVDIFLKSADRQGESGHDVRVSRSATWMSTVGGPVMTRTTHHFSQKIHIRRPYIETCVSHAPGVRGFYQCI